MTGAGGIQGIRAILATGATEAVENNDVDSTRFVPLRAREYFS